MSTKAPCGPEIICPAFATFTDAYLAILGRVTGGHQYQISTRGNTAREILNARSPSSTGRAEPVPGRQEGQHCVQPRRGAVVPV